jgi:hypothetical protein
MRALAVVFVMAAAAFLAGVILQVFLAGLSAFKLSDWTAHAGFGWLLASFPLFVLVPLAFISPASSRTRTLTIILTVAAALQPELAGARTTNPMLAAMHPVNALLVFWLAWQVARNAMRDARRAAAPAVDAGSVAHEVPSPDVVA